MDELRLDVEAMIDDDSGFLADPEREFGVQSGFTDVETLRVSSVNVIARAKRYGRYWLLKALRPDVAESPAYRRQLQKEFELQSRLRHPGVAQAVTMEEVPRLGRCIVTEWVDGSDLSKILAEGSLSKKEKRRLMRKLTEATAYLHERGITHRDLKPANVMIRRAGGEPVIVDFGLADSGDYVELKAPAGTSGYVSPEQRGATASAATSPASGTPATSVPAAPSAAPADDVYSLGVMMTALCGPGRLSRCCMGPLVKRPRDAGELLRLMERREKRPKRIAIAVALFVLMTAGIGGALHIRSLTASTQEARASIAGVRENAEEAGRTIGGLTADNARQREHIAQLTDSLHEMTARMTMAEERLRSADEAARMREAAYADACRRLDALLARNDREVFAPMSVDSRNGAAFADSLAALHKAAEGIWKTSADPHHYPLLTPDERAKIHTDAYNYYLNKFSTYQSVWLKRMYPDRRE